MKEIKFEEALAKLEKLVADLEGGNLSLEESLKRYEEGIELSRLCLKKLETAKKKVEILVKKETGETETKPFEMEAEK